VNKKLLHVGCGPVPPMQKEGWDEIRLDIDPAVKPDIVGSITSIPMEDNSVDGVYSAHNLEHLYSHEVPVALKEFFRVLRKGGSVVIAVPDIHAVAVAVASGELDQVLYTSPSGPVTPADVLWGFQPCVASGNGFYQHKTGFTKGTLEKRLTEAGFKAVTVVVNELYELGAVATKQNGSHFAVVPGGIMATP
jgi:ubiquinone/menaquinone biosynthesis C-methylase UbiE